MVLLYLWLPLNTPAVLVVPKREKREDLSAILCLARLVELDWTRSMLALITGIIDETHYQYDRMQKRWRQFRGYIVELGTNTSRTKITIIKLP